MTLKPVKIPRFVKEYIFSAGSLETVNLVWNKRWIPMDIMFYVASNFCNKFFIQNNGKKYNLFSDCIKFA